MGRQEAQPTSRQAPEQIVVEAGPKNLDAVKERMEKVASVLDLPARMRSPQTATNGNRDGNSNDHAKTGALSRWPT